MLCFDNWNSIILGKCELNLVPRMLVVNTPDCSSLSLYLSLFSQQQAGLLYQLLYKGCVT